jgi:hypothetical protein
MKRINVEIKTHENKYYPGEKFRTGKGKSRETYFWLSLLKATGYLLPEKAEPVLSLCDEVIMILCSILKTTNENSLKN